MRRLILFCVLASTSVLFAQEKTVDQGVYTSAQAARGAKLFESNCVMCHREPGGTAPPGSLRPAGRLTQGSSASAPSPIRLHTLIRQP